MEKERIAEIFEGMAVLADLNGENPFKSRAYSNAARAILDLPEDLQKMVEDDSLTSVDGIGKNIAAKIAELVTTGKLDSYEKMRASVPDGVLDMLKVPGLGPKKVRLLWKDYSIKSLAELEMSCQRHVLADIPGFGNKTEINILAGIASLKRFAGKWLLSEAHRWADEVLKEVRSWRHVKRAEIAGSIRRHKEIVKDIDIVVSTTKPADVMEHFVALPFVENVIQHGKTKSEVILNSGIQCDLRAVSDGEYPFALHHFTGSKEHNIHIRSLAKSKKMKVNEYGLFKGDSEKSLSCRDEEGIYRTLGLSYIEPELREDMGEIEAASHGALPKLVEFSDLKGVIHVHTNYSDGDSSIADMAEAAKSRGFRYLAVCDHSQSVAIAGGMKPKDIRKQHEEIDRLNEAFTDFKILKGIEADILADGSMDYGDDILASFDVVIAAVHSRFKMNEEEMTDRIMKALSNPHVDILAHPTGRLLLSREPYAVDLKRVVDAAGEHGKAIEINAHPHRLDLDWRWLRYARDRGVRMAICPDAHSPDGIDHMLLGLWIARKGWLRKEDILNSLEADDLLKQLKRR